MFHHNFDKWKRIYKLDTCGDQSYLGMA